MNKRGKRLSCSYTVAYEVTGGYGYRSYRRYRGDGVATALLQAKAAHEFEIRTVIAFSQLIEPSVQVNRSITGGCGYRSYRRYRGDSVATALLQAKAAHGFKIRTVIAFSQLIEPPVQINRSITDGCGYRSYRRYRGDGVATALLQAKAAHEFEIRTVIAFSQPIKPSVQVNRSITGGYGYRSYRRYRGDSVATALLQAKAAHGFKIRTVIAFSQPIKPSVQINRSITGGYGYRSYRRYRPWPSPAG